MAPSDAHTARVFGLSLGFFLALVLALNALAF